jgi:hypothetical protein
LSYLCRNGNVIGAGVAMETRPLGKNLRFIKVILKITLCHIEFFSSLNISHPKRKKPDSNKDEYFFIKEGEEP